jgi:thiol-disulfide isomerase/thioredoxin
MIAIGVGLALIAFVAVLATRTTEPGTVASSPLTGQPAPKIAAVDVMNGHKVNLASERGHYVVVAFFASWCPPCAAETPQLVAFLFAERKIHASVLSVIYDDTVSNAVQFLRSYGADWPTVADVSGSIAAEYGVDNPPEAFVVAPSGRVVAKITGGASEQRLLQIVNFEGTE